MTAQSVGQTEPWNDAVLAAAMIAVDPDLGGVHVKARAGIVRDRWVECVAACFGPEAPFRRIAAGISEARLAGGLDIGATLEAGRPVVERGVLACADGGLLVLAMAERLGPTAAGVIGMALDSGHVRTERDGVSARQAARFALVALDEGIDQDEALALSLADRLGLRIDLNGVGWRDTELLNQPYVIANARQLLPSVSVADDMVEALCAVALSVDARSMRASLHLMHAARASAALRGRSTVEVEDAAAALRLVLGLQPKSADTTDQPDDQPAPEAEQDEQPSEPSRNDSQTSSKDMPQDMLVEALDAIMPRHLLAGLEANGTVRSSRGLAGKAGAQRNRAKRGRAIGVADKPPSPGARIDVLATLRQAAPWQGIRAQGAVAATQSISRLHIRKDDFRYIRYREKTGTTAIFAVDASGSAAVERLGETKGAIELLLAECYVRRDSVALIAFRGKGAETLLEPTRSLVRAKRCLSALPGGGGTPLASGILATLAMASTMSSKGQTVVTVFLTDGRGNVGLDGTSSRERVADDTGKAAGLFRAAGFRSIVIDTAQRPQPRAEALARDLAAEYLPMPRGGSKAMAREIGARMEG
ncbi:magnesium chelatase subunit D [Mesorhizobium loti]|uniref:Magnesium chelatase subunit D n=1 Tax=Mesorhizobium loti R88b TaxID=935548 RepID=A0A6M7WMJ8_RHILI|nr:magnesium chelatase subunit D [Mesorhizobium loti]QKD05310.1 magnesium chelatase subunit D [Mesorhizobium loti R88b]